MVAGVEVQIQPGIPGNGGCRDRRPVGNPLHDIEPGVLILGLVHIRIIDQMGSAFRERGFAGQNLVRPIEQRVDFRKMRLPRIGIVGKGRISVIIVRIDLLLLWTSAPRLSPAQSRAEPPGHHRKSATAPS